MKSMKYVLGEFCYSVTFLNVNMLSALEMTHAAGVNSCEHSEINRRKNVR
jgi:hypothetical protein